MDNCEYCNNMFQADSRGNCNSCGAPHKERRPGLSLAGSRNAMRANTTAQLYEMNDWRTCSTSVMHGGTTREEMDIAIRALRDIARGMNNA